MAIMSTIICASCGKTADVMHSPADRPKDCHECRTKAKDAKRTAHFAELDALSTEARLRRVEEWIYDYKPPVPLSEMRF